MISGFLFASILREKSSFFQPLFCKLGQDGILSNRPAESCFAAFRGFICLPPMSSPTEGARLVVQGSAATAGIAQLCDRHIAERDGRAWLKNDPSENGGHNCSRGGGKELG
jgi:hypothetical protein